MPLVDAVLVSRAVRGDAAAIGQVIAQIRPGVVMYCRARLGRFTGSFTTADDVAQEVCLAVLGALPRYQDRGRPFSALVYTIAANKVADAHRAAARATMVDVVEDRPDPDPGPEQQALAVDLARRLATLLDQIPMQQREIVVLRVAVGLSAEEVGAVLGLSAAAVRMAQSRALTRLRSLAGSQFDEVAV